MPDERMPEKERDKTGNKSHVIILSWWKKIHFSGRVIICSVLFGFGLVLIGSLVFAINMDDESSNTNDNLSVEMPIKAPSNIVGPVLMGIGSFITVAGIVMCLFETQVCRKRTGDSSPLIQEGSTKRNNSVADDVPSTSQNHGNGGRKADISPNRSKARHAKDKKYKKTGFPKSPSINIETHRNVLTSSDEGYLTPPNTLNPHPILVHSNSRDAENQTSSSLMKSFNSSVPTWTQSFEFQTPSASFTDTSMFLNDSVEVNTNFINGDVTLDIQRIDFQDGFLTPVELEHEQNKNLPTNIENEKESLSKIQSNHRMSVHCNDIEKVNYLTSNEQKNNEDNLENEEIAKNDNNHMTDDGETKYLVDKCLEDNILEQIDDEGNNILANILKEKYITTADVDLPKTDSTIKPEIIQKETSIPEKHIIKKEIIDKSNSTAENHLNGEDKVLVSMPLPVSGNIEIESEYNKMEVFSSNDNLKKEQEHLSNFNDETEIKPMDDASYIESSILSTETSKKIVLDQNTCQTLTQGFNSTAENNAKTKRYTPEIIATYDKTKEQKSQQCKINNEIVSAVTMDCENNSNVGEKDNNKHSQ